MKSMITSITKGRTRLAKLVLSVAVPLALCSSAHAVLTVLVYDLATGDPLLNAAPITSTAAPGSDQSATTFWGRSVSDARDNLQTFTVGPGGLTAQNLYFQYDRSDPFGGDMQIRFFQTNNPEAAGPSIDVVLWTETVSLAGLGEPDEGVLEVRFDPTVLSPNTSYGFQFLDRNLPFLIREHNNPGDSLGGGRYWEQGWTAATRFSDMAFGIDTIPEPSGFALAVLGLCMLVPRRRR